mgnify:CR=1 FL=1
MFDKLLFTCNAVLPIILLIILGYFLKAIKLFPESFFKTLNKLCFRVCLPTLLFFNIYKVENLGAIGENYQIILYAALSILCVFFIGLVFALIFIKDDRQKGVIIQCCFRSNYALIGIPLAEALANGNPIPVGLASIVSAISIPLFNKTKNIKSTLLFTSIAGFSELLGATISCIFLSNYINTTTIKI